MDQAAADFGRLLAEINSTSDNNVTELVLTGVCDGNSGDEGLWYVGVLMSIVASILGNLGVNTQKYSMMKECTRETIRPYVKQPIWMLGLLSVIVGAVGDFAALGFAAQSLITPVGGFSMVANLVFAHFWLHEDIGRLDVVATILIIGGIVLSAAFADRSEQCFTLDDLIELYGRTQFIIYAVCVGSTIVILYGLIYHIRRIRKTHGDESREYLRFHKIQPIATASLSALWGAQSVLFAKSSIELFKSSFEGDNQFTKLGTYLILISMLFTIFAQIHWLAVGLQDFDATLIVPVFQSLYTVGAIVSGASYFDEFRDFNTQQKIFFPIGVLGIVVGVQLLTLRQKKETTDDGEHTMASPSEMTDGSSRYTGSTRRNSKRTSVEAATVYGAVTGRYVPALMIWNELPDVPIDLPEIHLPHLPRHHRDSKHKSLPHMSSNVTEDDVRATPTRINRSFAHIESSLYSLGPRLSFEPKKVSKLSKTSESTVDSEAALETLDDDIETQRRESAPAKRKSSKRKSSRRASKRVSFAALVAQQQDDEEAAAEGDTSNENTGTPSGQSPKSL